MRRARDARGGRRGRLLRRTGRRGLLGQLRRLRHRAYQQEFIGETRKADRHSPVRFRPTAVANTAAGGRGDDRTQPAQNENRLAKHLYLRELRPADEPRIAEVLLVVEQLPAVGKRAGAAAGLGENQLPRRRVPLVGVRRADVVVDAAFGQQAEFVGTALLDDLQIGVPLAKAGDMLTGLGRLVRTRKGHARMVVAPLPGQRQRRPIADDLVVGILRGGVRRDMLLEVRTRIAARNVHLFEIGNINNRPHADVKALDIRDGHSMIVQKSAFLASEEGVELSMHFQKKLGKGMFGGEGFIMQKLSGNGTAFVEIDGHAVEYELDAGQEILISTGYLAAMEETCTMDVVAVKGVKNMLVGGEGVFNTVVRGPGKVILQTMPISKVAELLTPFFTKNK